MVGGINPLGFLIPLAFVALCAVVLPALLLPWKVFCACAALGIATPLVLWYASDIEGFIIVMCSAFGVLALAIALWGQVRRRRGAGPLRPKPSAVVALLLVVPVVVVSAAELGKLSLRRFVLPAQFANARPAYLPRTLLSQCEVDVWQLPISEIPAIPAAGWLRTPYPVEPIGLSLNDRWLNGVGCSKADARLIEKIVTGMLEPGAMYLPGAASGLILVPSHGILVRSYAY